jgi:hypothetical protein
MNALLFAPALALLMLQACSTGTIIAGAALAIAMQVRHADGCIALMCASTHPCAAL